MLLFLLGLRAVAAPFDGEPFSDSAEVLLEAASGHEDERYVDILLEDHDLSIDEEGLVRHRTWRVYEVRSQDAAEYWGHVGATWQDWREERPAIEARVIRPDGTVIPFDPTTLVEQQEADGDRLLYTDERTLSAPLPQVTEGTVVETLVTWQDTKPLFDRGSSGWFNVRPARQYRVSVDAPKDRPLGFGLDNLDEVEPKTGVRKGRRFARVDFAPPDPWPEPDAAAPRDVRVFPAFWYSTVGGWSEVDDGYRAMIGEALDAPVPEAWVAEVQAASGRDEKVRRAYEIARDEIRYTGLELGQGSLVPRSPVEVAEAGFGDCKEKAVLMVGLLEEAGIEAAPALITTSGPRRPAEYIGIERFNHVVVRVGEDWFDPTASWAAYGEFPASLRGREALVLGDDALVDVPWQGPEAHTLVETRTLELPLRGTGRVTEHSVGTGWMAAGLRPPDRRPPETDGYTEYAADQYRATIADARAVGHDLSPGPAELELVFEDAEIAFLEGLAGETWLPIVAPLQHLPGAFFEVAEERETDLVTWPYRHELRWRIEAPPGFRPMRLPSDQDKHFGPLHWTTAWRWTEEGVLEGDVVFDTGDGVLSADEARDFARWASRTSSPTVQWQPESTVLLATGDLGGAIARLDALIAAHPDEPEYRGLRAILLTRVGLRDEAIEEILAVEGDDPGRGRRLAWAGLAAMSDRLGRDTVKGMDRDRAVSLYREAHELLPDDVGIRRNLGLSLLHDDHGNAFTPSPDLAAAREHLQAALDDDYVGIETDIAMIDLRMDEPESARDLLEQYGHVRLATFVGALALTDGVDSAVGHVNGLRLPPADASRLLLGAAAALLPMQEYEAVNGLVSAAERLTPGAGAPFGNPKRYDELELDGPLDTLRGALAATLADGDRNEARKLISKRVAEPEKLLGDEFTSVDTHGLGLATLLDLNLALSEVVYEEKRIGARIRSQGQSRVEAFFTWERGGWRMRAYGTAPLPVAREALWRLERGDEEAARMWTGWALELSDAAVGGRALESRVAERLDLRDPEQLRWMITAMVSFGDAEVEVTSVDALPEGARELALQLHLAIASTTGDLEEVARLTGQMAERTDQIQVRAQHVAALAAVGRLEEAEAGLAELRAQVDGDPRGRAMVFGLNLMLANDPAPILEEARSLAPLVDPGNPLANEIAWALAFGTPEDVALGHRLATQALSRARNPSTSWLHTVATLQVLAGDHAGAVETMRRASPESDQGLTAEYGYVLGQLAELAGLEDAARAHYRHVVDAGPDWGLSAARLARIRLEALDE